MRTAPVKRPQKGCQPGAEKKPLLPGEPALKPEGEQPLQDEEEARGRDHPHHHPQGKLLRPMAGSTASRLSGPFPQGQQHAEPNGHAACRHDSGQEEAKPSPQMKEQVDAVEKIRQQHAPGPVQDTGLLHQAAVAGVQHDAGVVGDAV